MEKKKTIKIGEYATIKNKSKQGIYQAIKRPNNKYQKYITTDEDGKIVFKIEILKELDIEEKETTENKQEDVQNNVSSGDIVILLKEQVADLKKEIEEKNKQIERLQITIENNQHIINNSQKILLLAQGNPQQQETEGGNAIIQQEDKPKKHKILWFLNK